MRTRIFESFFVAIKKGGVVYVLNPNNYVNEL